MNAPLNNKLLKFALPVVGLLALSALTGCTRQTYGNNAPVNEEPLTVDLAMQQREWDKSTAYYQNGDVHSWSTGFAYRPKGDARWQYYFADPGTYFVNLVTLPWTLYEERDGVTSEGDRIAPTYTAVPPLPPSDESLPASPTTQPGA